MNESYSQYTEPIKEHVPIPFMEGYEIYFCGGQVNNEEGFQVQTMHIWKSGDDEEGWDDLTGVGFYKVVGFLKEKMEERNIKEFVIEGTDDRRQRVFEKWFEKKEQYKTREIPDWDGDLVKIFTKQE